MRLKIKLILMALFSILFIASITINKLQQNKIFALKNQLKEVQRRSQIEGKITQKRNKIDRETIQQIENISTGDVERDFNAGLDELRKLSENKRK